ncbi:hypothetical protein LINPERHAP1_LOCUS24275 [Linum perenne]
MPANCTTSSARRTVSVTVLRRAGEKVLSIVERCKDGRCFYVLVPSDRHSGGWRQFLGLILARVEESGEGQEIVLKEEHRRRSFAEIVAPNIFCTRGDSVLIEGKVPVIQVSEVGVLERVKLLRKGLVFRVEVLDGGSPDWVRLRRWMARFWGTPMMADIRALGDDLWMLGCTSEGEVERIISLNRWEPPGFRIKADMWLNHSGTSDVEGKRGWKRVLVKGIPLHLRSEAVLRDITGCFGKEAICLEEGGRLNELRVKILASSVIPNGFWLQYRDEKFWLSVCLESKVGEEKVGLSSDYRGGVGFGP